MKIYVKNEVEIDEIEIDENLIKQNFYTLNKALIALEAMVNKPMQEDRSNVDACLHRFKFTRVC